MGGTGSVVAVVDVIICNVDRSAEDGCLMERDRKIGNEGGIVGVVSSCDIGSGVEKDNCGGGGGGGDGEDKGRLEKAFGGKEDEWGGDKLPAADELREEEGVVVLMDDARLSLLTLLLLLIFRDPNAPRSEVADESLLVLLLVSIVVEAFSRAESRFLNMLLNRSLTLPLLPRLTLLRSLPTDDDDGGDVDCESWVSVDADGEGAAAISLPLAYIIKGTSTAMVSVVC